MSFGVVMSGLVAWMGWSAPVEGGNLSDGPVFLQQQGISRKLLAASLLMLGVVLAWPLQAAQDEGKVLREYATKFWEARVKGDWATVYDYLSPEERSGKTRDKFIETSKQTGPWRYLHYKIGAVEAADDMGWVKIEYSQEPVQFPGIKPKIVDRWEKWEKVEGRWTLVPAQRFQQTPQLPPSLRPLEEEKALKARAEEFWKAREKNDYTTIYYLCAPDFRKKISLEEWLTKKAQNLYVSHDILWAEVNGNQAKVRTVYEYRPNDPSVSKMDPLEETAMQGWIKIDGRWYLDVRIEEE